MLRNSLYDAPTSPPVRASLAAVSGQHLALYLVIVRFVRLVALPNSTDQYL
jgi:hypothetical protein